MDIKAEIIEILHELSCFEQADEKSDLVDDIGLDSLGLVNLLVMLEDRFGIELNESDMNPFDLRTLKDVVSMVERYVEVDDEK